MNTNSLPTIYHKVASEKRYTIILMLIILILAGLTIIGLLANKPATIPSLTNNSTGQSSKGHLPGHDFGAIYSGQDPLANSNLNIPRFSYTVGGQLVSRSSELGPLTGYTYDILPADQGSEVSGAISVASSPIIASPLITYTIAGQTMVRDSELGPLTGYTEDALLASSVGQNAIGAEAIPALDISQCTVQLTITYTIAGQTITRHSELGPLADSNCIAFLASIH